MEIKEEVAAEEMGTKPALEHAWLHKLVGDWDTESEMTMEEGKPPIKSLGQESVKMLGELWASGEGKAKMPNGDSMEYRTYLGYDVSFREYRGCWLADVSSHLWKYTGTLSADRRTMTLECVGPHMVKDGETANYRDVIEIIDENHRTLTSSGQDEDGNWSPFMKVAYRRR